MVTFRDNERQLVIAQVYQADGLKVERQRRFTATSILPDVEIWRNWSFQITIGGTRYVRYRERSHALAPGTIFWNSPVHEPVKAHSLAGSGAEAVILTFSLQRWRQLGAYQPCFRERNAALLASYPEQPILALQIAPPQLLYALRRFLADAARDQTPTAVLENGCHLLLELIANLQFTEHFQRVDHAQRERVEVAQARIVASLAQPPNVEAVADELGISLRQLQRDFSALTGLSPLRYRNIVRLTEANTLLADTGLPIATIAARLGYTNVAHFSAAFRQLYHCSPSEVREAVFHAVGRSSQAEDGRDAGGRTNHATT